jgi:regulator of sirC expression with transglutaminase-like and TPR domain
MAITPGNLDALLRLLGEPDDTLIEQVAAMADADLERLLQRRDGAGPGARAAMDRALVRRRYRSVQPAWEKLKGADLEQGLILISRTAETQPQGDVAGTLDAIAEETGARLSGDRAFDNGLEVLAGVLFRGHHLRGNENDYYAPENSYLSHVLNTGLGIPITLCSVAILVGRRLELPVAGVGAPGHFLGFYGDVDLRIGSYFDPFDGFRRLNAGEIRVLLRSFVETVQPAHLRPVGDGQILARVLRNLAGAYAKRGEAEHVRNLEEWISLNPA